MMNGPQFIWAGIRGNNLHQADQGDVEYVRKDLYDAQANELIILRDNVKVLEGINKRFGDIIAEGLRATGRLK
jgi:hypothetical protein